MPMTQDDIRQHYEKHWHEKSERAVDDSGLVALEDLVLRRRTPEPRCFSPRERTPANDLANVRWRPPSTPSSSATRPRPITLRQRRTRMT